MLNLVHPEINNKINIWVLIVKQLIYAHKCAVSVLNFTTIKSKTEENKRINEQNLYVVNKIK